VDSGFVPLTAKYHDQILLATVSLFNAAHIFCYVCHCCNCCIGIKIQYPPRRQNHQDCQECHIHPEGLCEYVVSIPSNVIWVVKDLCSNLCMVPRKGFYSHANDADGTL
jgi:hypothetical protein